MRINNPRKFYSGNNEPPTGNYPCYPVIKKIKTRIALGESFQINPNDLFEPTFILIVVRRL